MMFRFVLLASGLAAAGMAVVACSSDSTDATRRPRESDSGSDDAGTQRDVGPVDPNNGRDEKSESCFASCQNTAFTCQAKSGTTNTVTRADLQLTQVGCEGKLTDDKGSAIEMKIECLKAQVCVGSAPGQSATTCAGGRFSAFSFSYTPGGATMNVCTRD
jgi:hypothetical protein